MVIKHLALSTFGVKALVAWSYLSSVLGRVGKTVQQIQLCLLPWKWGASNLLNHSLGLCQCSWGSLPAQSWRGGSATMFFLEASPHK